MPTLTDSEAQALIYFAIGVSSEGADKGYQLSLAGHISHNARGEAVLHPAENSGYTIGTLQSDLGQSGGVVATQLTDAYQAWAEREQPDWLLSDDQRATTIADLSRDGNHIKKQDHGRDLDATVKSHMQTFLASDDGITFVHDRDIAQVNKLMTQVVAPLSASNAYQQASAEEQAEMIAITAKAYNQNEGIGRRLVGHIADGTYKSVSEISGAIDHCSGYMQDGRDHALAGTGLFNTLQHTTTHNAMRAPWQDVLNSPLANPTQLAHDAAQPNLSHSYPVIKDMFVDPTRARQMVNALEAGGSYARTANGRGFYAEGSDLLVWDRHGRGHALTDGTWRDVAKSDLVMTATDDHALDVSVHHGNVDQRLLQITHPGETALRHAGMANVEHIQHPGSLREHDRGSQVQALQSELAAMGLHDDHGHPIHPDGKFGPATKAAVKAFQRNHHLADDGIAGPNTEKALHHATLQQSALTAITLDHPQHPGHPIFQQALAGVGQLDRAQGRPTDMSSYNLSGVLALAARREGLERIDHVILSEDATRAIAVQGDFKSPLRRFADVDVVSGVNTPLARSSTDWSQLQPQANQAMQAQTPLMQSAEAQVAQPFMQR